MRIVTAVSEVEIDIVVIIFVLLSTVHLGIVGAIAFVGLTVVVVILLVGDGWLYVDGVGRRFLRCVSRRRGGGCCWLGRCFVVVALRSSVLAVQVTWNQGHSGVRRGSIQIVEEIILKVFGLRHCACSFVVCRGGRLTLPRCVN